MPDQLKEECQLAINLFDMDRIVPSIRDRMGLKGKAIGGNLDTFAAIKMENDRENEVGVPFVCDISKAALILDNIREQDVQAGDPPTRIYLKIGNKTWKRVASTVPLTIVDHGQCRLNPKLFPIKRQPPLPLSKPPRRFL